MCPVRTARLALVLATFAFGSRASAQEPPPLPPLRASELGERLGALEEEFRAAVAAPLRAGDEAALRALALGHRDRLAALLPEIEAYVAGGPGVSDIEDARDTLAQCLTALVKMSVAGQDVDGALAWLERTRAAFPDGRCDRYVLPPVANLLRRNTPERAPPLYDEIFRAAGGFAGPTLDGARVSLADFRGRVVFLQVWQSG